MKKEYRVSNALLPYVKAIMHRRNIRYSLKEYGVEFDEKGDNQMVISGDFSGTYFHKIIVRASVEKICKEQGMEGLYLAKSEAADNMTVCKLLKEYNTQIYQVLE